MSVRCDHPKHIQTLLNLVLTYTSAHYLITPSHMLSDTSFISLSLTNSPLPLSPSNDYTPKEFDVEAEDILNARMVKKGFGNELFDECLRRCGPDKMWKPPVMKDMLPKFIDTMAYQQLQARLEALREEGRQELGKKSSSSSSSAGATSSSSSSSSSIAGPAGVVAVGPYDDDDDDDENASKDFSKLLSQHSQSHVDIYIQSQQQRSEGSQSQEEGGLFSQSQSQQQSQSQSLSQQQRVPLSPQQLSQLEEDAEREEALLPWEPERSSQGMGQREDDNDIVDDNDDIYDDDEDDDDDDDLCISDDEDGGGDDADAQVKRTLRQRILRQRKLRRQLRTAKEINDVWECSQMNHGDEQRLNGSDDHKSPPNSASRGLREGSGIAAAPPPPPPPPVAGSSSGSGTYILMSAYCPHSLEIAGKGQMRPSVEGKIRPPLTMAFRKRPSQLSQQSQEDSRKRAKSSHSTKGSDGLHRQGIAEGESASSAKRKQVGFVESIETAAATAAAVETTTAIITSATVTITAAVATATASGGSQSSDSSSGRLLLLSGNSMNRLTSPPHYSGVSSSGSDCDATASAALAAARLGLGPGSGPIVLTPRFHPPPPPPAVQRQDRPSAARAKDTDGIVLNSRPLHYSEGADQIAHDSATIADEVIKAHTRQLISTDSHYKSTEAASAAASAAASSSPSTTAATLVDAFFSSMRTKALGRRSASSSSSSSSSSSQSGIFRRRCLVPSFHPPSPWKAGQ